MKRTKTFLVLTCLLWLAAGVFGAQVNDQTAASAVKGWLRLDRQPLGAAMNQQVKNVQTFKDDNGAPLYHVVSLEPSGFVIIPADDRIEPIIAFSDNGHFDPSPDNPLAALINRDLPGRVARARAGFLTAATTTSGHWQKLLANAGGGALPMGIPGSALSDLRVAPFINTLWDQRNLFTVVTNWIWITNELVITTHFVPDSLNNLVNTSVAITNHPTGPSPSLPGIMRITNGPGNPVIHSFPGGVFPVDINNGPGTTVTNLISVSDTVIIVVTNEFGDVVANQTPVWVGTTIITNIVSGANPGTTTTHVIFVDGFQMIVSDFKACYNYFTPPHGPGDIRNSVNTNNYYCGCVATAMAQLMYYFRCPSTGVGKPCFTVTVDGFPVGRNLMGDHLGNGGPYDWNNMPLAPDYYTLTPLQAQSIGAFTCDAGLAVHMQYAASESGAYLDDAKAALVNTFQYSSAVVNYVTNLDTGCMECGLYNMMNPNLDARLPVLLGITGDPGGHCIVVDGYGYNFGALYHHLNMGWSGVYNAWYALPIIDMRLPDDTYSYFYTVLQCIYNVYTNGSGEIISGRVVDQGTNPVVGASITANRIGSSGNYTAVTDARGIYSLAGLPSASTFSLTVTKPNYFPASSNYSTGMSIDDSGASGNVWGANFTLVSAQGAPVISPLANQAITVGENAAFTIGVTGELPLHYQWQISADGGSTWTYLTDVGYFGGSGSETLTITQPDIATLNGASFQCIVSNGYNGFSIVTSTPPAFLSISVAPLLTITTLAGSVNNPGSTDGIDTAALFKNPMGIAVENNTNVYVADKDNHIIRKLTLSGTNWVVNTIAGTASSPGSTDGTNGGAKFKGPYGITVGGGNVYVADTGNHTIRKLTPSGTNWVVTTIAGLAGNFGSTDGSNSNCRFKLPFGIATDSGGSLYVADEANHTIRKLTLSGTNWVSSTIAGLALSSGSADGASSTARFNNPNGVAVDSAGNVYVADTGNNTIRRVKPVGGSWTVNTIAGQAYSHGSADGLGIPTARFYSPTGVAVNGAGNIYVADNANNTVRWLTPVGTNWMVLTVAGLAGSSGSADGTGNGVRFHNPYGIAVGDSTNVYVTDSLNSTIRGTPLSSIVFPLSVQITNQITSHAVVLTWPAVGGHTYQVQYKTNFNQTIWNPLMNVTVTAFSDTGIASIPIGPDPQRFYRVVP